MSWNYYRDKDEVFTAADGTSILEATPEEEESKAGDISDGSLEDFAAKQMRAEAMGAALAWIEGGDYSYSALDAMVAGISDLDGNEELDEEEQAHFNDLLTATGEAFVWLGAKSNNVQSFIESEGSEEGAKLGNFLSSQMDETEDDDETLISKFVVEAASGMVMESVIKVVRNGQLVFKKKRIGKFHPSAAQRAGLKAARMKSHTGAAKVARRHSMHVREQRGM
jgi:hypothetical protein